MDHAITRAAGATPSTTPPHRADPRSWAILLTSANHGVVGPVGSTFPHAGEKFERLVVTEVPSAVGAPLDQVNLQIVRSSALAQPVGEFEGYVDGEPSVAWFDRTRMPEVGDKLYAGAAPAAGTALPDWISYDAGEDALTMHDIVYSAELFRTLGIAPVGESFTIVARNNGVLVLSRAPVAAQAGQVATSEERQQALDKAMEAAEKWANVAWAHAKNLGAGGRGTVGCCNKAEAACRAAIEALAAAPAAPAQAKPLPDGWISVDERLPEGRYCLATYRDRAGKLRFIRAMYVRQYEVEATGDECSSEINEADDVEYLKAGWLECIDNWGDYSSVYVCEGPVTHWMPLPAIPGAQASTAGGRQEGGQS